VLFKKISSSFRRVILVSRKPTWDEFKLSLRIALLGILIIGTYAFIFEFVAGIIISSIGLK
jgi:protein transport protein SEC61 subunit gamma-like protein